MFSDLHVISAQDCIMHTALVEKNSKISQFLNEGPYILKSF